jgi:hypothetical protein
MNPSNPKPAMSALLRIPAVLLLLLLAAACGKDESTGPEPSEITGTWIATKVEFDSKTTSDVVELVGTGGGGTLVLSGNNRYELTLVRAGRAPDFNTGSWSLDGDVITLAETGMPFDVVFNISLTGGRLEMTGGDVEFDFADDGTPEEADLNLAFTR